jgi:lipopolysaccharide transport system ATP-binding protein
MSSNVAIKLDNVSKCHQIYDHPLDRLRQALRNRVAQIFSGTPKKYYREFWSVKNISIEVLKGQTVGLIGKNGSGKSTVLQLICDVLKPTSGEIYVDGRVAALLELGSGFNPEFTGRENVCLNAAILGLSQSEIESRFLRIVEFSGIADFIDRPIKTYSSGMVMRLAFSVIAHVDADILVIDEALSVGDAFFTQKCMRFLHEFQKSGKTILFVSHDLTAVKNLCNRAALMLDGAIVFRGDPGDAGNIYLEHIYADRNSQYIKTLEVTPTDPVNEEQPSNLGELLEGDLQPENIINIGPFQDKAESFGKGGATIIDVFFEGPKGGRVQRLIGGSSVCLKIKVKINHRIKLPIFGFIIKDRLSQFIFAESTDYSFRGNSFEFDAGDYIEARFYFDMPLLFKGEYFLTAAFAEGVGDDHFQHHYIYDAIPLVSLQSRMVHGICGVNKMHCQMHFIKK